MKAATVEAVEVVKGCAGAQWRAEGSRELGILYAVDQQCEAVAFRPGWQRRARHVMVSPAGNGDGN
jgi:hypothetical protein